MKKTDLLLFIILILLFLPFFVSDTVYSFYENFNTQHAYITSFIKFAILATYGEVIGARIRTGMYSLNGFGLIPRMVIWGILGIFIKAAFVIFSAGAPVILGQLGMNNPGGILAGPLSWSKLLVAFCISLSMNLVFSPVLMTLHRITDTHIMMHKGLLKSLVLPVKFRSILKGIDWDMHWGFVLKKTIPFFWIPAHTVTFLLPVDFQILFAALLGVVLGIILAFAASSSNA